MVWQDLPKGSLPASHCACQAMQAKRREILIQQLPITKVPS